MLALQVMKKYRSNLKLGPNDQPMDIKSITLFYHDQENDQVLIEDDKDLHYFVTHCAAGTPKIYASVKSQYKSTAQV